MGIAFYKDKKIFCIRCEWYRLVRVMDENYCFSPRNRNRIGERVGVRWDKNNEENNCRYFQPIMEKKYKKALFSMAKKILRSKK